MQTSYSRTFTQGRSGQVADIGLRETLKYYAEGNMTFGLVCQRGTTSDQVQPIAALPSADADAIIASGVASAATAQIIASSSLNGVVGSKPIPGPCQRISVTLNSHADWLASSLRIYGVGPNGDLQWERLSIPAGGNTVLYTIQPFRSVTTLYLDAQGGTNGTLLAGTDPTVCALDSVNYPGIVCYDSARESYAAATEVESGTQVSVVRIGRVYAVVEAAVEVGWPVYVRMVESGSDLRGQVRGSPATNFFPLIGATFASAQASADQTAIVQLR